MEQLWQQQIHIKHNEYAYNTLVIAYIDKIIPLFSIHSINHSKISSCCDRAGDSSAETTTTIDGSDRKQRMLLENIKIIEGHRYNLLDSYSVNKMYNSNCHSNIFVH